MGRDASTELEQASFAFLSAINADSPLEAVVFLRRTGSVLASWTRRGIPLDIVSVMGATMLASIDTIIETIGGAAADSVSVYANEHQIVTTKIGSQSFLFVIAPKSVSRSYLRREIRRLVARLTAAAATHHRGLEVSGRSGRVKVRPPQ